MKRAFLLLAGSLFLTAIIWFALLAYFSPHCVPADRLALIRAGMSKEEVITLLGPPRAYVMDVDNHRYLSYWRDWRYCTVDVHLDGDDHVQTVHLNGPAIFHDH